MNRLRQSGIIILYQRTNYFYSDVQAVGQILPYDKSAEDTETAVVDA